jgi:hypothetical protein
LKPDLPEVVEVTLGLAAVLDELAIPYLVGGSLASSVHGVVRFTQDADLVVDLPPAKVAPLLDRLRDRFYVDADRAQSAVARRASFNLVHLATMVKVDLFVLPDEDHARQEMARRRLLPLPGTERGVPVASPEDIILQKLRWYRLGGEVSERQWTDAAAVVRVQGERLDREYLSTAAMDLGVQDLLVRLLGQIE